MITLNREIFHHPTAKLPENNTVKRLASVAIMEEGAFEASFYYLPSEGLHIWLCDIILDDGLLKEALAFQVQRGGIAHQNNRDLQQTIDARSLKALCLTSALVSQI